MKVKTISLLTKLLLVLLGFGLCVLKWFGIMPEATVTEIWGSVATAYGIAMGTVDFNIIRDNWLESERDGQQ